MQLVLTPEILLKIQTLHSQGRGNILIAKELGIGTTTVIKGYAKLGIITSEKSPKAKLLDTLLNDIKLLYESGYGSRVIAEKLNISRDLVKQGYKLLEITPSMKRVRVKKDIKSKFCNVCNLEKELEEFRESNSCNNCVNIKNKEKYREKLHKDGKKLTKILPSEDKIIEIEKLFSEGFYYTEIEEKLNITISRIKTVVRKFGLKEKYKLEEREKIRKERSRKEYNEYRKLRLKSDIIFRLKKYTSINILSALKKHNSNKNNNSIIEYLPYSMQDLKSHLEDQFEIWMSWDNHGNYRKLLWNDEDSSTWTWQIDHIIPQECLPYTSMEDENFKQCWALNNLRPYSAKQNVLDGSNKIRHKYQ